MIFIVLDQEYDAIGILDSHESIIWTDRYQSYGDFEAKVGAGSNEEDLLWRGAVVVTPDSRHCMLIEHQETITGVDDGDYVIFTGRSAESLLDRRIAWGTRTLTGSLEDGLEHLFNVDVINSTDPRRNLPITFKRSDDPQITSLTVDTQYTGTQIYDIVEELATINHLGFRLTMPENDGNFVFELYAGVDRSYNQTENPYVIFSPKMDNLLESTYLWSSQTRKTHTLIGGEGEGAARRWAKTANETAAEWSGLHRREMFTDARDISSTIDGVTISNSEYTKLLEDRGKSKLSENVTTEIFDGKVEYGHTYTYGLDFNLGDVVWVENQYGDMGAARVTEYIRSVDSRGVELYPTFDMDKDV